jgi:hypothetical protein
MSEKFCENCGAEQSHAGHRGPLCWGCGQPPDGTGPVGTDGPQTGLPAARELLPCPFCGDTAKVHWIRDGQQGGCGKCFARGPAAFNGRLDQPTAKARAAELWNTRASGGVAPTLSGAEGEIARLAKVLTPPVKKDERDGITIHTVDRCSMNLDSVLTEIENGMGKLDEVQMRTLRHVATKMREAEDILDARTALGAP